jgi:ABC-type nitrate/sulfonate/bicarbonate transport system substrate-binding protein
MLGNMKFKCICVIVQLSMFLVALPSASAQSTKVIIGYANFSPTYAPVWVAKEMGFFDRNNLHADIIFIRGGAMATQALVGRSIDFMVAGGVAAVEATLSGAGIVIIAVPSNRMDQVLVARKEISQPVQLKGKKIAVLGLAYKPDVDDLRESPANEIVHLLQDEGAYVKAWEPFKPDANLAGINMSPDLDNAINDADALLLLVNHTEFSKFNPVEIAGKTRARILIDTVNGWNREAWEKAGFQLFRLGDNKMKIAK